MSTLLSEVLKTFIVTLVLAVSNKTQYNTGSNNNYNMFTVKIIIGTSMPFNMFIPRIVPFIFIILVYIIPVSLVPVHSFFFVCSINSCYEPSTHNICNDSKFLLIHVKIQNIIIIMYMHARLHTGCQLCIDKL